MRWALGMLLAVFEIAAAIIEGVLAMITGVLGIIRVYLFHNYSYLKWLKRDLAECETILELGCGANSPIVRIGYGKRTDTIEIFQPYVDKHNWLGDYHRCTHADILTWKFPEKAYDAVVMFDVLEHLPQDEVYRVKLFESMERCAKQKVIFFTPNGFVENDLVDGDPHQAHKSAWEPKHYLERGYTVRGTTGIRWILGKGSKPKYHPYSVFEIIAMLSLPLVYNHPKWAWHSYAVKGLK